MPKRSPTIRWSTEMISRETGKHPRTVKQMISSANLSPGVDNRFATHQVIQLFTGDIKENEARRAKNDQAIDEAAMVRNERELQEGKLVYRRSVFERVADAVTKTVQIIRGTNLSERDKKLAIVAIRGMQLEPRKVVAFEKE